MAQKDKFNRWNNIAKFVQQLCYDLFPNFCFSFELRFSFLLSIFFQTTISLLSAMSGKWNALWHFERVMCQKWLLIIIKSTLKEKERRPKRMRRLNTYEFETGTRHIAQQRRGHTWIAITLVRPQNPCRPTDVFFFRFVHISNEKQLYEA